MLESCTELFWVLRQADTSVNNNQSVIVNLFFIVSDTYRHPQFRGSEAHDGLYQRHAAVRVFVSSLAVISKVGRMNSESFLAALDCLRSWAN